MQLSEVINSNSTDLRVFAGLQMLFCGFICLLLYQKTVAIEVLAVIATVSLTLGIVGLLKPDAIRWFYVGWMLAVFPIGWIVSHLMMAIVYYGVVTPIGMWRIRSTGDPLKREFDPAATTYWEERDIDRSAESYFRQF